MAKKRLLIADDDPMVHKLFPQYLGESYEYLHVYNGVDALVLALDLLPDLVILDIAMPILDGRTVCKKLKEYPKTAGIKILMVSGKDEQFDRALGFEVGADDYLGKSQVRGLLKTSLEKLLR
jgi:DNA-binding response OmpR family regulator